MKYANAERFLKSYNKIESQLKILYGGPPTQAFTDLVKRCSDRNITVRRYENELIDYGKLRNAIVHRVGGGRAVHRQPERRRRRHARIHRLPALPPARRRRRLQGPEDRLRLCG